VQESPKTAVCACGAVSVSANGEPIVVNACSCTDCQRRSGSSFTYTAFYPNSSVTALGAVRTFRNVSESGRWRDSSFCPTCGVNMITKLEVFPQATGVPVGALIDAKFSAPKKFYWAKHKHDWYSIDAVSNVQEQ
jgi:hypothetical protein